MDKMRWDVQSGHLPNMAQVKQFSRRIYKAWQNRNKATNIVVDVAEILSTSEPYIYNTTLFFCSADLLLLGYFVFLTWSACYSILSNTEFAMIWHYQHITNIL